MPQLQTLSFFPVTVQLARHSFQFNLSKDSHILPVRICQHCLAPFYFKGTIYQDVALICSAGCGLNAKRQRKWMWHLKQLVMRESKRLRIVLKLSPTKQQCFVRTLRAQVQISSSKYTNLSVGCNYWCISDSESLFLLKILDFVVGFRPRSFESYYRTDVQSWW